jgi:hypothetical protein
MNAEGNDELRECARRALEKNPARGASASLRNALRKASDPKWKIGLMNSLGERGDARSVRRIARELDDPQTGPVAALALGKIASSDAVEALWRAFGEFPEAGEALINAANALRAKGDDAKAIYKRIAEQAKSKPLRTAAEFGLAQAGG